MFELVIVINVAVLLAVGVVVYEPLGVGNPFQVYDVAPLAVSTAFCPAHTFNDELYVTLGVITATPIVRVATQVLV